MGIGHCIYAREPIVPGNQAPGVEGCYDKKQRRSLGFSDADLQERFRSGVGSVNGGAGAASGKLMDEATIKRMIAAERKKELGEPEEKKKNRKGARSSSRSRGRKQCRSRSRRERKRS